MYNKQLKNDMVVQGWLRHLGSLLIGTNAPLSCSCYGLLPCSKICNSVSSKLGGHPQKNFLKYFCLVYEGDGVLLVLICIFLKLLIAKFLWLVIQSFIIIWFSQMWYYYSSAQDFACSSMLGWIEEPMCFLCYALHPVDK